MAQIKFMPIETPIDKVYSDATGMPFPVSAAVTGGVDPVPQTSGIIEYKEEGWYSDPYDEGTVYPWRLSVSNVQIPEGWIWDIDGSIPNMLAYFGQNPDFVNDSCLYFEAAEYTDNGDGTADVVAYCSDTVADKWCTVTDPENGGVVQMTFYGVPDGELDPGREEDDPADENTDVYFPWVFQGTAPECTSPEV